MRSYRRTFSRKTAQKRSRQQRSRRFESLEARQMLNAAPVANDDTYTVAEDGVLSVGSTLPANVNPILWAENGHYYAHVPAIISSWRGAETAAANMRYLGSQGHLVSMTTAGEEAFVLTSVVGHLPPENRVYVGGTDRHAEGEWKWVTGEPVSYSNWRPGEPTPGNNDEDYMAMYYFPQGWLWGDIPDNGNFTGSYIVEFDGPFANSLLVNDTDADNDALTAVLIDGPDHGKLDLKANGSFTYSPDADFDGTDSFTYKAHDGQADSNVATVTVTVTPNAPPVANNDTFTVSEDAELRVGESNLPAGVVPQRFNDNGHYYALITNRLNAPDAFVAAAGFNYQGSPGHLVTITSAAEQNFLFSALPWPSDRTRTIGLSDVEQEGVFKWITGEPLTFTSWNSGEPNDTNNSEDYVELRGDRLWNDHNAFDTREYIVEFDGPFVDPILRNDTDAEGDPLTAILVAGPQSGTLSLDANGTFVYTPNTNFVGTDTFTYKVNDGDSDSNVATVRITVTPNVAPVANNETYTIAEDTVLRAGEGNLPAGVAPQRWSENGHYYAYIPIERRWLENETASKQFEFRGSKGHLVTVNSSAEHALLVANLLERAGRDKRVHMGLTDRQSESSFQWITGEPVTFTAWVPGEPNNSGDEDFGEVIYFGGAWQWNDINDAVWAGTAIVEFEGPFFEPVVANDTDAEGDPLAASLVAGPQHGTLSLDVDGKFVYTPNRDFVGTDTFTYKVNDGHSDSNVATVTINLTAVNDAPVVNPERYVTAQNKSLTVSAGQGVLSNDTDAEGDSFSAALVTGPSKGQLTLNPNGSFTYIPNSGYFGPDSFTYEASDGKQTSEATKVSLFVTNPNNVAPVAQNDSYTTAEDTVLLGQPTLPGGIAVQRWSENGHYYAHVTSATNWLPAEAAAANMTYLGSAGHLVTLTSAAEEAFLISNFLSNWVANPVFIGLTDRAVEGDFRWITGETVTYTNWTAGEPNNFGDGQDFGQLVRHLDGKWRWDDVWDSPHFGSYIVEFDGPFAGGVLANDSDANSDALSAALVAPPLHGTVTLNAEGTFVYTPNANYNGPDSFTYKANDGQFDSNVATVNITVTPVNDAPTAAADNYTVAEDTPLTKVAAEGVLVNDSDLEGSPLTASLVAGPAHGTVTLNPDGSFTYTPNANFFGSDAFTYRASDTIASQPATVTIQVTPSSDAPTAANDTVNLSEDSSITFTGTSPQGFTPVQWSANGHYYAQVRGEIKWPAAKAAAESLRYRGAKGHLVSVASAAEHQFLVSSVLTGSAQRYWIGLTDEGTEGNFRWLTGEPVAYTNWGQNQPDNARGEEHYGEVVQVSGTPLWLWNDIYASFDSNGYVVEFEGPFNKGVLENDVDVDNDALTAALVSGPSQGKLQLNADGTFTYTPNADFSGTDSFTYKASDGTLESNVAKVTLNVAPGNDPPVAAADSYFVADKLTVNAASGVLANDTDVDTPKASLTAQLVTSPTAGTLSLNANGSFTYTRGLNFTGSDTFTYRTSDGSSFSAPVTVTVTAALRLRTENVSIVSQPLAAVEGFFDVYVDVAPGFDFSAAGYDVALRTAAGSGVTLVSAAAPSAAHPSLFATPPTFVISGGTLRVTDALATGAADVDNGDGLFRVRFTVAPETVGNVPLLFTTAFTNLADENGNPLPIDRAGGTIAVTEPPAPRVTGVLVRGSEWSNQFANAVHPQGLGSVISAGEGQLADVPWINVDQIVVRFNEHVSVQQADLAVHGVNNATYAISGFAYNPATFTATWTLDDPLPADKVRIQLSAGGGDPIRNAAGVRLDGDWSDATSAYPSGNGRSGGDFQFRFDVLPGNTDQIGPVNIFDTIKTRNRQFTTIGDANYNPLYDVNGSGDINIFDTIQVRNHQFTSLPDGEPTIAPTPPPVAPTNSPPEPAIAPAPFPVRIRTENVTVTSQSSAAVEGVFDVFVDVMAGASISVAGYDVALRTPSGSGVTLVSAGMPSAAHPGLFTSEPTDFVSQNMLGVTDALPTGAVQLDNNDGLFSVRFSVAPGTVGSVPLLFNTIFTNLADAQGNPVPLEVEPGVITITPPPTTITGTSGDDQYHVIRSGSQLRIYQNTPPVGQPTYTYEIAAIGPSLIINALGGNDSLTVDTGGQATLGIGQLIYTAGAGANTLTLAGGSARIDGTVANGTLNTTVQAGAHLSTSRLAQNDLTLENSSRVTLLPDGETSVITSLTLGTGATFDIGNNALVVDYTGASPVTMIREKILSGRGGPGLGANWNGTGITSSAVAQANLAEPESRSIGYAENASLPLGAYNTFRGVLADDTAVLIAYTRTGDANLDGFVNDDDATVLGASYAPTSAGAVWALGDFEYNGFVDDDDATLLGVFYSPAASTLLANDGDDALVELLAEAISSDAAAASTGDRLTEPRLADGRKPRGSDVLWSEALWR